jgi:hypothetical protein
MNKKLSNLVSLVKWYLDNILYATDKTDEEKTKEFNSLFQQYQDVMNEVTQNEADYILSQWINVRSINQYTIPAVKASLTRFVERFNLFYGLQVDSDLLISDLNDAILNQVTWKYFKRVYLGDVEQETFNVAEGIKYGSQGRLLFCLPVRWKGEKAIWCTFLYDSGSKHSYLSRETLAMLGAEIVNISSGVNVHIWNTKTEVLSSELDARLNGINVLGDVFFTSCDCDIIISYRGGICTPKLQLSSHQ